MSLFEFIMVLLSMIVGLGIAEILAGVARALLYRRLTADAWHLALLSAITFVSLVQIWWEAWILHDRPQWNFLELLAFLVTPTLLYTLSHLLFPRIDEETSLRAHYFDNHRLLYGVVGMTALSSLVLHPIASGERIVATHSLSSFLVLAGSLALATSANPVLHSSILPVAALLIGFDVAAGAFVLS